MGFLLQYDQYLCVRSVCKFLLRFLPELEWSDQMCWFVMLQGWYLGSPSSPIYIPTRCHFLFEIGLLFAKSTMILNEALWECRCQVVLRLNRNVIVRKVGITTFFSVIVAKWGLQLSTIPVRHSIATFCFDVLNMNYISIRLDKPLVDADRGSFEVIRRFRDLMTDWFFIGFW